MGVLGVLEVLRALGAMGVLQAWGVLADVTRR